MLVNYEELKEKIQEEKKVPCEQCNKLKCRHKQKILYLKNKNSRGPYEK